MPSQFAVTGLGAVKGAADKLVRDEMIAARRGRPAGAAGGDRARGRASRGSRTGRPRRRCPFMALGAIVNANNAFLPPDVATRR